LENRQKYQTDFFLQVNLPIFKKGRNCLEQRIWQTDLFHFWSFEKKRRQLEIVF